MPTTYKKNAIPKVEDNGKPCKCGTGSYCHRHLRYGPLRESLTMEEPSKKTKNRVMPIKRRMPLVRRVATWLACRA